MRFNLTDDQQDLAQHAGRFFERARAADHEAVLAGKTTADPAVWGQLTGELGLAGIAVGESDGGGGGTLVDLAVVLEAAGQSVSTQPLLASAGAAVAALQAGVGDQARKWLGGLAAGELVGTWADPASADDVVRAEQGPGGWLLHGRIAHVPHAEQAGLVLIAAHTPQGERIFGVTRGTTGLDVHPESALDPTRPLGTIHVTGAPAMLAHEHLDAAALRRARAVPAVLLAAEQAGVARGALHLALSHARERQQFGRAIGSFQALKHLLADMLVDVETARDVARYGVWSLTENADDPEELAAMTHAHVSDCAVRVASSALQVLGGIGYTWEHPGHLYYKRTLTSARLFTTVDRELDRLAVRIGIDGPS
ncbi:acyl-CoA dehydrogenase family protein [Rhodococcus oxybenzonivorans]|nr:acyl-CoA dehydrogenase family protein [Rhodococcus oxybenzonivorans]